MMRNAKDEVIEQMIPEAFLKKCLSGVYENVGTCRVFTLDDALDTEYAAQSQQVEVCNTVEQLKQNLTAGVKSNLLVSGNLVNRTLLNKLLQETSQVKNILYGDF